MVLYALQRGLIQVPPEFLPRVALGGWRWRCSNWNLMLAGVAVIMIAMLWEIFSKRI
jgi:hypothetical protein